MTMDPLLTCRETTNYLSISKAFLYVLIKRGDIPKPVKLGTASRWRQSAIDAAITKMEKSK